MLDNAAKSHGVNLGLDVLFRMGQSLSSLGTPQWEFLTSCRDPNTIFNKGGELLSSVSHLYCDFVILTYIACLITYICFCVQAFAAFVQHNFKLNNEVATSRAHAQEARDAQLKLADELKAMRLEAAAGEAAILKVSEQELKLKDALEIA